jgi:hypothetical protein
MQNTQDVLAESLYKGLHDVASSVLGLESLLPKLYELEATSFSFFHLWLRLRRARFNPCSIRG